jgi:uncharacterized protein
MTASVANALEHVEVIDEQTVSDLALGATLLGTGGGGDPRVGALMAQAAIREFGSVRVITPDAVEDDGVVVPLAMIGAPTVILERIPGGHELDLAMAGFEHLERKPVVATMPIEAGGINSTIPLVLAARRGLPLVDADGMGRAFPEVQMVTLGAGGVQAWPLVLADESSNVVMLSAARDNASAERLARATVVAMGGSAVVAHYALSGQQLRAWAVPHSVSLAVGIGRALRRSREEGSDPVEAIAPLCGARRLFTGQVIDVRRSTEAGFVRGRLMLKGLDEDGGRSAEVDFQNENLIVRAGDDVLAAVPDLISLVEAESGQPLTTEGMRFGLRVQVIGVPSSPIWWRPEALPLVEPRAFGYDMDPIRMEDAR